MSVCTEAVPSAPLILDAETAADLMTPHVVSLPETAAIGQAAALLTDKNLGAVPVLNADGQPVGVLSRSDIVAHDGKAYAHLQPDLEYCENFGFVQRLPQASPDPSPGARGIAARVGDIMNRVVYSVAPETPAATVISAMRALSVHRLFVTGEDGRVVGVISTMDVIQRLRTAAGQ